MDSGTLEDSYEDLNSRGRCRWTENRIVYTRRAKRKAHKDNNNIATNTSSVADNLAFAAPPTSDLNPTPTATEASYATVGTVGVNEVSTVSVPEELNSCATARASPPATVNYGLAAATSSERTSGELVELEPSEGVATKGVDSHQTLLEKSPHQNKSYGSPDKGMDSFGQQMLQEQEQQQEQVHSVVEDENSNKNQVRGGCLRQDVEGLSFPDGNEAHNWEKSLVVDGSNEALHLSDDKTPNLGERSPLSCKNDPPNGQGDAALVHSDRSDERNELVPGSPQAPQGNSPVIDNRVVKPLLSYGIEDKIRINICKSIPKNDIRELRKKLEVELDRVRKLVQQFESKELQIASYGTQIISNNLGTNTDYIDPESANVGQPQPLHSQIDSVDRRVLVRLNSEMSEMGHQEARSTGLVRVNSDMGAARNLGWKPYSRQLSVAVMENNLLCSEFNEKEKRTPKANKYYRNSEFLLGKDRLPAESNKRFKANNGRKRGSETVRAFGFGIDKNSNRVFKSCSSLLQRLMKHKYGWVFNEPVDAKALGLIDYHDIIKHPMDLGTIKARLLQNLYKFPTQFAEDMRLVFRNAMTYNPKGQDVHFMAEQLLQIFEERWAIIETDYNRCWKYQMYQDGGLATPPSRKVQPQSHPFGASVPISASIPGFIPAAVHAPIYVPTPSTVPLYAPAASLMRTSERLEPMAMTLPVNPKIHRPHVGRTPVPKKPKAKDPDKRDMTYDEKQRLSNHLQGLPMEKLDAVVQIIKKRNTALSQHDDEIEVDIDSVDTETLWELDRFVTNYKKSLSKNKRKAELLQARMAANQNVVMVSTTTPVVADAKTENGAALEKRTAARPEGEKKEDDSRTSSSNSSSSDSGSSSSDSDSDSSSADGSGTEHSDRT